MKLRNMTAIYLTRGDEMLLLYRQGGRVVRDLWIGSAGGHFEPEELNDPRACVLRELQEETGLTEKHLEGLQMRYICLRSAGGEIRQNYYFFAQLKDLPELPLTSQEGRLTWFPLAQLSDLEMPCTAKCMLEHYLAVGRFDRKLYCGAADGSRLVFTELADYPK